MTRGQGHQDRADHLRNGAPAGVADNNPSGRASAGSTVRRVVLTCLVFLFYPLTGAAQETQHWEQLIAPLAGTAVAVGLFVWAGWQLPGTGLDPARWTAVAAITGLGVGLPLAYGGPWLGLLLYVAVLAGLALPPGPALAAAVILTGTTAGIGLAIDVTSPQLVSVSLAAALAGLSAMALRRLIGLNQEVLSARSEVARLAAGEERLRLSRELHDSIKQHVFVAAMELGAARAVLKADSGQARAHLTQAQQAVSQVQLELTDLVDQLRVTRLDNGLVEALQDHLSSWSARHGVEAELTVTGSWPERPDIEQALFRAAREALVNVARHAAATRVQVALTGSSDRMNLTVADNGRGLAAGAHRNGHGLSTMKERLEAVRGTMTVTSRPGAGTALVFCWRDDEGAGK